jgi:hypothetical protein
MIAGPSAPGACPRCGATNPVTSNVCQYCGGPLAPTNVRTETPYVRTEDSFRLVTSSDVSHPISGTLLLVLGILFVVIGIGLLALAAGVHQSVESFNQACSQNPLCQPQSDPSGGLTAGGVVLMIIGIILAIYGYLARTA